MVTDKRLLPETHDRLTIDELRVVFGESIPVRVACILATPTLEGPLHARRAINRILTGEGE